MALEAITVLNRYVKLIEDPRITVWHISLYLNILKLWQENGFGQQVKITRQKLMAGAHIGSITTYHKCINQLQQYGYIVYLPTFDCYSGSIVEII